MNPWRFKGVKSLQGQVGSKVAKILSGSFHEACARVCTYGWPAHLEEEYTLFQTPGYFKDGTLGHGLVH